MEGGFPRPHLVETILLGIDEGLAALPIVTSDDVRRVEDDAWAELSTDVDLGFITPDEALHMFARYFNNHHRTI